MPSSVLQRGHNSKPAGPPSSPDSATVGEFPSTSHTPNYRRQLLSKPYGRTLLLATVCAALLFMWSTSLAPAATGKEEGQLTAAPQTRPPIARIVEVLAKKRHALHGSALSGPLSPNASVVFSPFKDLCEWVTGTHTLSMHATAEMPAAAYATDAATRALLESALDRFNHLPADGGAAGRRWSAATGLPLASQRTGEVRVRFLTVTNRVDATTHFATVAAAMAGVRLEVVGMGWKHFTFTKRTRLLLSYAEHEKLTDSDVIVATDADAVMSGEDAELFLSAFIASTAASEEEHMTYRVRDIRMGKRQTPVVFSAERTCWAHETFSGDECERGYYKVCGVRENWVQSSKVKMQHYFENHAFKYLNAGVMVARVWALRHLDRAFYEVMKPRKPRRKWEKWTCDQSAFAALHLDLMWWELESHAWDGPARQLPESKLSGACYPPQKLPDPGRGPHHLPFGLINIDPFTRLSLTIEPSLDRMDAYAFNGQTIKLVSEPERGLASAVAGSMPGETSPMGLTTTRHRLAMSPRNYVDCHGVNPIPPECAYRDAVWGVPEGAKVVVPLLWHFSGDDKVLRFAHYRALFPWYTPTLVNTEALQRLVHVFANLPPTRVFSIDPGTDNDALLGAARVLPRNVSGGVSCAVVCRAIVLVVGRTGLSCFSSVSGFCFFRSVGSVRAEKLSLKCWGNGG